MFGFFGKSKCSEDDNAQQLKNAFNTLEKGDIKRGMDMIMKLAVKGYPEAEYCLGDIYEFQIKNLQEAAKWYQFAAEHGHLKAQRCIANFLMAWVGGPCDRKKAFLWYTKLAEQGVSEAQFVLGEFYRNGSDIPKDLDKAIYWYGLAKKNGFGHAEMRLKQIKEAG